MIKRYIRRFANWLKQVTDQWVVSSEIMMKIDDGKDVEMILQNIEKQYPYDPYITYARTLSRLMIVKRKMKRKNV